MHIIWIYGIYISLLNISMFSRFTPGRIRTLPTHSNAFGSLILVIFLFLYLTLSLSSCILHSLPFWDMVTFTLHAGKDLNVQSHTIRLNSMLLLSAEMPKRMPVCVKLFKYFAWKNYRRPHFFHQINRQYRLKTCKAIWTSLYFFY